MKFASLMLVMGGSLLFTGCSDMIFLNPIVTDKQSVTDSNLTGTWKSEDNNLFVIQASGSGYSVVYTDGKGGSLKLSATLFKVGDAELLDVVNGNDTVLQLPVHAVARIWLEASQLRWTFLDSKWIREQAVQQLASQPVENGTLLTAPGDAVRAFLLKYGGDPKAYGDTSALKRVP